MPTYEYVCPSGHRREVRRPIAHRDLPACCVECQELMTRQVAAPAFAFRGTGFFATDYAKPRPAEAPETE